MNVQAQIIGVLTGGGDCAGLNPAMKWVVKTAMEDPMAKGTRIHFEVLGIRDGWKDLAGDGRCHLLRFGDRAVRACLRVGVVKVIPPPEPRPKPFLYGVVRYNPAPVVGT